MALLRSNDITVRKSKARDPLFYYLIPHYWTCFCYQCGKMWVFMRICYMTYSDEQSVSNCMRTSGENQTDLYSPLILKRWKRSGKFCDLIALIFCILTILCQIFSKTTWLTFVLSNIVSGQLNRSLNLFYLIQTFEFQWPLTWKSMKIADHNV